MNFSAFKLIMKERDDGSPPNSTTKDSTQTHRIDVIHLQT